MKESIGQARKQTKSECINKIITDHSVHVINSDYEVRTFPFKLNHYVWCQTILEVK